MDHAKYIKDQNKATPYIKDHLDNFLKENASKFKAKKLLLPLGIKLHKEFAHSTSVPRATFGY